MTLPGVFVYAAAFVAALAILVVIHELGHFLVARAFDVKVLRFAFGFGKVLWVRRFGADATEWAVCAVPLGGYVKMLDESEGQVDSGEVNRAFNRKPLGQRALIVAAGPVANLLLAVVLYAFVFGSGVHEFRPILGEPPAGSVAASASIKARSTIVRINGNAVTSWQDVRWIALNDLLDNEVVSVDLLTAEGVAEHHELVAPAGLGNQPEQDSLRALGLVLQPLRLEPLVGAVLSGSPAQAAGVQVGDRFQAINGQLVTDWSEFSAQVRRSPGIPLVLDVARGELLVRIQATPAIAESVEGPIGRLGISPYMPPIDADPRVSLVRYGAFDAFVKATQFTWETSVLTLRMIGRMILGEISWKNVSGPVTMADYAGQSAHLGLSAYLRFLALISISLGVLNLLPIPVLDGGHLLYYLLEFLTGKPLPESVVNVGQRVGIALLGLLMVFAFYNDINRLVSG
ncbi:MAG: RIP metalloprotease RseP [Rhodocyclaceae bacterium]|nr:RIP metalloprotease RseP [Rhodocyclaceae bacterium]